MNAKLLGNAAILMLSTLAAANPVPSFADDLYIWDTAGRQIGTHESVANYVETLRRQIGKTWYEITYSSKGFVPNAEFYYQKQGCLGQRYFYVDYFDLYDGSVLPPAVYEDIPSGGLPVSSGKTLWSYAPGVPAVQFIYQSVWVTGSNPETPPHCENIGFSQYVESYIPAVPIDTTNHGFAPPFCASVTATRCPAH